MHEVRALLDSGSQSNFITTDLAAFLNLNIKELSVSVIDLNCVVLDKITNALPTLSVDKEKLKIPSNIVLADSFFNIPSKIDILIGAEVFYELLSYGQIKIEENLPILQKTCFGWIVSGRLPCSNNNDNDEQGQHQTFCNLSVTENLSQQIERFWKLEEVQPTMILKKEELECEELFVTTTKHNKDGRFIVQLPTKGNIKNIGSSLKMAEKRFLKLERKLGANQALKNEYSHFLQEYEELGHMSKLNENDIVNNVECVYYMPHHAVVKEDSTTTKLRVVFDASAKTDRGISLNEELTQRKCIDKFGSILHKEIYNE
ncbi:uncharacterized protein LOC126742475 [Anthonomus grandis grandis]|uniref:uncharacterized protein LOC126742475 n=1 Tax=Anthonomus grandis grandis TaxID=2921223 RepID=UPI00216553BA|nr:uncharacterized protein LOC126742475 [Anthonomus grandis grandis]